ncbi:hypothetical protein GY45DRAFT_1128327 [Cubamyces sp. BRFM 1775]|nr:hypothetical protein GY45DRAFT_1128327 [Cubamyces sp. BRFM 1775]
MLDKLLPVDAASAIFEYLPCRLPSRTSYLRKPHDAFSMVFGSRYSCRKVKGSRQQHLMITQHSSEVLTSRLFLAVVVTGPAAYNVRVLSNRPEYQPTNVLSGVRCMLLVHISIARFIKSVACAGAYRLCPPLSSFSQLSFCCSPHVSYFRGPRAAYASEAAFRLACASRHWPPLQISVAFHSPL